MHDYFIAYVFEPAVKYFVRSWKFFIWESTNNIFDLARREEYQFLVGEDSVVVGYCLLDKVVVWVGGDG